MKQVLNWPYPKNPEQLVKVVMIGVMSVLIAMIVTVIRYNDYKEQTLQKSQLSAAAAALSSYASESAMTLSFANDHKVTQNFRETYASQIADQVGNTYGYIATREVARPYQRQANQLVKYGSSLEKALKSVAQPSNRHQIHQARQRILHAQASIQKAADKL